MSLVIVRQKTGDEGSFGRWYRAAKFICYVGELPWRDNASNVSCIPVGDYIVSPYVSPRFGKCLIIQNVKDRSYILVHAGNWMGDALKGYRTDLKGCIAPGMKRGRLANQSAVLASKTALNKLMRLITRPTPLTILENY